jgi:beta-glucanase (GH16 family)
MSKLTLAIMFCLTILSAGLSAQEKTPPRRGWKLIWRDEFNGSKIDPKKWNVLTREHSKHNELQYYVPDDVYIENGCLRLRSRVRDFGAMHYTSGRVDTKGKLAPVYGRFEIRARLPGGKGLWPAHWLYPQNRDWQMEYLMVEAVRHVRLHRRFRDAKLVGDLFVEQSLRQHHQHAHLLRRQRRHPRH